LPDENQKVNPSFNISSESALTEKPVLLLQAGKQGVALLQLDSNTNTFIGVQVYHFAKGLAENNIAEEISSILNAEELAQQHFKKIYITWCFDESVLVPDEYFDSNSAAAMLNLVYGDAAHATMQNEIVLTQNMRAVYRVPVAVRDVFNKWMPFAIQGHQNSMLVNFDGNSKDLLYASFYTNAITVLLRKNGQLQVIQNFEFSTPEDAAYYLLQVCQAFDADATQTILTVSGMIDADSNLYNELYKYFVNIRFAQLPQKFNYTAGISNYPEHYFSHLFFMASCVL
jgi:Protein of unknown function (DUF3822)